MKSIKDIVVHEMVKVGMLDESILMYPHQIQPKKIEAFLKKYPQVEKSMKPFISARLMQGYRKWLNWKGKNEDKLGGTPHTVNSPSFGSKTFYKHDWNIAGIDSWAAVFQYLTGKQLKDSSLYSSKNESVNESIKYKKGKLYQTGGNWTVFKSGDLVAFDIKVNSSAGWSTDPHDARGETIRLMDAGKKRATLRFKEGNINNFAKTMHKLNDETTWGETEGLSARDYADILRIWLDMIIYSNSVARESVNESTNTPMMSKSGKDIFVDTTFVQLSNKFGTLEHIWMGDFVVKTKEGDVEFRRANKQIDGFSGRTHQVSGNPKAINSLIKNMKPKVVKESVNEGVRISLVDPNTNKFVKTLSLNRTYKEAEGEVETLNKRLSTAQKDRGFYWKVTAINESKNDFSARYDKLNILLKKGYKHHTPDELEKLYNKLGALLTKLKVKDVNVIFEKLLKTNENLDNYSKDAITDMIINLSRYEGNDKLIADLKKILKQRTLGKLKKEQSVNEDIEPQTKKIASLTGTRPDAVKQFVSSNALNITKLLKFIEKGKLSDRMDFTSALSGKPNNPIQKKMIKMFQESVNETFIPKVGRIDDYELKDLLMKNPKVNAALGDGEKSFMKKSDVVVIMHQSKRFNTIFTDGKQEFEIDMKVGKLVKPLGKARKEIVAHFSKSESVNEASRRATDFYGDSKHGKALHSLLKGKWDSKKVEKFLDKLGDGNDVKYARAIDFISGNVGLNIRKYKTIGEQLPELMKELETLYTDFLTESITEGKYSNRADAMNAFFKGKISGKELDDIAKNDFNGAIATKGELAHFSKSESVNESIYTIKVSNGGKSLGKKSVAKSDLKETVSKLKTKYTEATITVLSESGKVVKIIK